MTGAQRRSRFDARSILKRVLAALITVSLICPNTPFAVWAQTRTQTYQPGEPFTGLPGGAPGRGYGQGPSGLPSVYCQQWPGRSPYPQYPGTGRNIPCGPNFAPPTPPPQPVQVQPPQYGGCSCPYDVRAAVPGADPRLNFALGFERGVNECLEAGMSNPLTLCLMVGAVLAAKFRNAAALAGITASGRILALGAVMQNLQEDINSSPDPYQTGVGYGRRFCIWMGAAVAFAPGRSTGGSRGQTGSGGGGEQTPPASGGNQTGQTCRTTPPVLNDVAVSPANANTWLPGFNQVGCRLNCGYIAAAVENALAGRGGVIPAPPERVMNTDPANPRGVPKAMLEYLFGRGFGNPATPAVVEAQLAQGGANARGILFGYRPGAQIGHFLNIVRYNGDVLLLDGQVGRVVTWQELWNQGLTTFQLMPTFP
jgi:hypothetical protein